MSQAPVNYFLLLESSYYWSPCPPEKLFKNLFSFQLWRKASLTSTTSLQLESSLNWDQLWWWQRGEERGCDPFCVGLWLRWVRPRWAVGCCCSIGGLTNGAQADKILGCERHFTARRMMHLPSLCPLLLLLHSSQSSGKWQSSSFISSKRRSVRYDAPLLGHRKHFPFLAILVSLHFTPVTRSVITSLGHSS